MKSLVGTEFTTTKVYLVKRRGQGEKGGAAP